MGHLWLFLQNRYTPELPYIIMAVDAFAAGILCLLLPETNNEPTAETLTMDSRLSFIADTEEDEAEVTSRITVV